MDWQMSGKFLLFYLDNVVEFKSEVLCWGCEQYGIWLDYCLLGQLYYGGIVEWIIGMVMQMIYDELLGMIFFNFDQCGDYDFENKVVLMLCELECWFILVVGIYYGLVYNGLF